MTNPNLLCTMQIELANADPPNITECGAKATHWISIDQSGQLARCPECVDMTIGYFMSVVDWDKLVITRTPRSEAKYDLWIGKFPDGSELLITDWRPCDHNEVTAARRDPNDTTWGPPTTLNPAP